MNGSQSARRLLAAERRAHILAALERDGVVHLARLMDDLGAAPVTVRRDLAQLEEEGLLVRVHGGAVAPEGTVSPEGAVSSAGAGQPEHARQPQGAGQPEQRPAGDQPANTIAVLVPSLSYYWPGVVRAVEARARSRGFRIAVRSTSYELQDERPVLQRLLDDERACGLLVAPNTDTEHAQDVIQWLAGCGVPSVLMERDAKLLPCRQPAESVTSDHALGGALAAGHFAELGHQRVGLVLARNSPTSRKIADGWHAACAELGLAQAEGFDAQLPDRSSAEFSAAINATLDTALDAGLTALLVHADAEAMAFIDLALNRGLSVPGDLSIASYDDEIAQSFSPALTAVCPPRAAIGEAALDLLADRVADPARPTRRVVLSPCLNVRDSTAPPRTAG